MQVKGAAGEAARALQRQVDRLFEQRQVHGAATHLQARGAQAAWSAGSSRQGGGRACEHVVALEQAPRAGRLRCPAQYGEQRRGSPVPADCQQPKASPTPADASGNVARTGEG